MAKQEFVTAVHSINRHIPGKKGKAAIPRLFRPGEKIPIELFTPEELEKLMASGEIKKLDRSKVDPSQPLLRDQAVVTTTGKDHIKMDTGNGDDDVPEPTESNEAP